MTDTMELHLPSAISGAAVWSDWKVIHSHDLLVAPALGASHSLPRRNGKSTSHICVVLKINNR